MRRWCLQRLPAQDDTPINDGTRIFSGLSDSKCKCACSVVSSSLQPHGLESDRLLCPWNFPGKSIGVGCHFLLLGIFLTQGWSPSLLHLLHCRVGSPSVQFSSVAQSCPTLCDPMNRSTPGLPVQHQLPEFTQTHVH